MHIDSKTDSGLRIQYAVKDDHILGHGYAEWEVLNSVGLCLLCLLSHVPDIEHTQPLTSVQAVNFCVVLHHLPFNMVIEVREKKKSVAWILNGLISGLDLKCVHLSLAFSDGNRGESKSVVWILNLDLVLTQSMLDAREGINGCFC